MAVRFYKARIYVEAGGVDDFGSGFVDILRDADDLAVVDEKVGFDGLSGYRGMQSAVFNTDHR